MGGEALTLIAQEHVSDELRQRIRDAFAVWHRASCLEAFNELGRAIKWAAGRQPLVTTPELYFDGRAYYDGYMEPRSAEGRG